MTNMFLVAAAGGFVLLMTPFAIGAVLDNIGKKQASKAIYCTGLAIYCFAVLNTTNSDNGIGLLLAILPPIAGLDLGFFLLDSFMGIEWEGTQACSRGYNCDAI
jgi:hypothetical protein